MELDEFPAFSGKGRQLFHSIIAEGCNVHSRNILIQYNIYTHTHSMK